MYVESKNLSTININSSDKKQKSPLQKLQKQSTFKKVQ